MWFFRGLKGVCNLGKRSQKVISQQLSNACAPAGSHMLRHWLEENAITFHHHQWGITPSTFHSIKDWQYLNDNEKESCKIALLVIPLLYIPYGCVWK